MNLLEDNAAVMAAATVEIVRGHAGRAVAFAEAYEPSTRILLFDGGDVSPSTRILPFGALAWERGADVWEEWQETVDAGLDEIDVDGVVWSFGWEDGVLWLTSDEHDEGEQA
jgi:hypothetical protein